MKSSFNGIVDIIMQKLGFFFLVVLLIAKRGGKKRKKGMALMKNLFDIDIDFQFDNIFVV
jgi:hypothetical protein